MTDNELSEVRGLIEEWAERRGADFYLPPRILELVGLPEMAILLLREDAVGHRQHGSRRMTHDQRASNDSDLLYAEADVLDAEANLMEAKLRRRVLEHGAGESADEPDFEAP